MQKLTNDNQIDCVANPECLSAAYIPFWTILGGILEAGFNTQIFLFFPVHFEPAISDFLLVELGLLVEACSEAESLLLAMQDDLLAGNMHIQCSPHFSWRRKNSCKGSLMIPPLSSMVTSGWCWGLSAVMQGDWEGSGLSSVWISKLYTAGGPSSSFSISWKCWTLRISNREWCRCGVFAEAVVPKARSSQLIVLPRLKSFYAASTERRTVSRKASLGSQLSSLCLGSFWKNRMSKFEGLRSSMLVIVLSILKVLLNAEMNGPYLSISLDAIALLKNRGCCLNVNRQCVAMAEHTRI